MASQLKTEASSLDLRGYQTFWTTVSPALVQRYRGKSVAVQLGENGWQIIEGADDLEHLRDSLLASGVDMDSLVLDRIPCDEEEEFFDATFRHEDLELDLTPNRRFRTIGSIEKP